MFDKVKDFFINQALGRVLVRASVSAAAYLASGVIGVHVNVDPNELNAFFQMGLHSFLTWLKPRVAPALQPPASLLDATAPKSEEAPK